MKDYRQIYDIAVVGAGAAGMIAAIRAAELKKKVILIEKNEAAGKKIMLTGNGRCNLTNTADMDKFIEAFGRQGQFLRSAFSVFFNRELIGFLKSQGLAVKIERQGRIFPVTDKAYSVVDVLKKCLQKNKVKVLYNSRLTDIGRENGFFQLEMVDKNKIFAKKVIIACGGASFKETGSCGDGFAFARKLGHTVVPLKAALVPLKVKEPWVKQLQGLALKNIKIVLKCGSKKIVSNIGEIMFTHFGVSGPLILDLSGRIVSLFSRQKEISLFIDCKPGMTLEQLTARLVKEFSAKKNTRLKNIMKSLLPQRLAAIFLDIAGVSGEKTPPRISRQDNHLIIQTLKALPLTVSGALAIEEAMVTNGGVSLKEINPKTMESRIIPGLYFAGEVLDGCAWSGGYNLQQAFSTGYLAGEKAGQRAG